MSEQTKIDTAVGSDTKVLEVDTYITSFADTSAMYLTPTLVLCLHDGVLHQLWRDAYSTYGEYRKVPEYDPDGVYKIA